LSSLLSVNSFWLQLPRMDQLSCGSSLKMESPRIQWKAMVSSEDIQGSLSFQSSILHLIILLPHQELIAQSGFGTFPTRSAFKLMTMLKALLLALNGLTMVHFLLQSLKIDKSLFLTLEKTVLLFRLLLMKVLDLRRFAG